MILLPVLSEVSDLSVVSGVSVVSEVSEVSVFFPKSASAASQGMAILEPVSVFFPFFVVI